MKSTQREGYKNKRGKKCAKIKILLDNIDLINKFNYIYKRMLQFTFKPFSADNK